MSFIAAGLGEQPIGGIDDADSLAVTDPLTAIASADPPYDLSEMSFIVIAKPYDFDTSGTVTLRAANDEGPSDVAYNSYTNGTEPFANRVLRPYNIEARLPGTPLSGEQSVGFLPGGSVVPTIGAVAWDNQDGALDGWTAYDWTNRELEVYVGASYKGATQPSWPTGYAKIFNGRTDRAGHTTRETVAYVRDARRRLQISIQPTLYAGTGGIEGGAEIKGQPKPLLYGQVRQAEPVLVDGPNSIYQLNDGAIEAVDAVRDSGAALAFDTDVADITTAAPGASEYATSLATGFIRLGADPTGKLTVDARGDNSGTLGYVDDVAGIVRKIATGPGGFTDPDDLELGTFDDAAVDVPYTMGYYIRDAQINVDTALDEVVTGAGGGVSWILNRLGRLAIHQTPADPSVELVDKSLPSASAGSGQQVRIDAQGFARVKREQASPPAYRVRLPYKRYWAVLDSANVAAAVPEATRLDYGKEWRWASDTDASVQTDVPSATVVELAGGLIDTSADADTEAARLLTMFSTERHLYEVMVENPAFQFELGQVVELTAAVLDLDAGKRLVVVGLVENPAQTDSPLVLTLWG